MKTIKAFIWGSAIGAALGLLFAPQRGEVTRAQLQERWNDFQSQAQTRLGSMPGNASGMIESGRQAVTNTISQAQSMANTAAEKARGATSTAANTAQDQVSSTR